MEGDDFLPLSALQHYLYCPRQCALIHVEQEWEENALTAEGRLLHERVDQPGRGRRDGVRVLRSLPLLSRRLGLSGTADVVEVRGRQPFPVEYKRGRPKSHRADEVQLCAQALCLEEMLGVPVPEGALYYGEERRRTPVPFDDALRALTEETAAEAWAMVASGQTPPPLHDARKCGRCSLAERCQPAALSARPGAADWLRRQLRE